MTEGIPSMSAKRLLLALGLVGGLVLAALVAWRLLGGDSDEPGAGPMVGEEAPEIADEVEQWVNGEEVDLADLRGKAVLLYFWHPRDGASPATLDRVQGFAARYGDDGLVVIGLCVCDEPRTPYCYLVGPDGRVAWEGPPDKLTRRRIRKHLP